MKNITQALLISNLTVLEIVGNITHTHIHKHTETLRFDITGVCYFCVTEVKYIKRGLQDIQPASYLVSEFISFAFYFIIKTSLCFLTKFHTGSAEV